MNIENMTRKDFDALPSRKWDAEVPGIDGLVILPGKRKHDSGFRVMDVVACRKNEAVCRLAGGSDVIHIEGIGGYGFDWVNRYSSVPSCVPPRDWSIDCLPKSGLLRLWGPRLIYIGPALSSLQVYSAPEAK